MMHFDQPLEPQGFHERCRQPGNQWLKTHPDDTPPRDYWSPFKLPLARGFSDLCAYSVMWIPNGTVDHYLSCRNYRYLAYEWANYRFCAEWMNKSKRNADDAVLDPFEVQDGWFQISLPSLQLTLTDRVPTHLREKAEYTLIRLHLRDDERVIRQRREWYRMYQTGELTLDGLSRKAPLIAEAVRRQQMGEAKITQWPYNPTISEARSPNRSRSGESSSDTILKAYTQSVRMEKALCTKF